MVKSKKISKPSKNGADRISDLPEPLLSQILSLLPAENAVATSALSKRWKFLWTSITTLNLDEQTSCSNPYKKGAMKKTKFTAFISKVLIGISPASIQNFRLNCTRFLFDPIHLNMWVTVIAPTVGQLNLDLHILKENMELKMNHFRFNNLVVLKLRGSIDFIIPARASVCFPNLQTLHVFGIRFELASNSFVSFPSLKFLHIDSLTNENEDSVHKLFSSCPVLDDLYMSAGKHMHRLIICIPSLTRLSLGLWCCSNDRVYEIQIHKLHKLKFLSISGDALKAILTASANASSDFHYLKRLEIHLQYCSESYDMIKHLLGSMDNLEHIAMTRRNRRCSCSHGSWWTEPLNVPMCLLSRVTTISFVQAIDDCPDELEVVRYLLKNAKVLQLLKLGTKCCSSDRRLKLIEEVSKFPKGSKACQVEFT